MVPEIVKVEGGAEAVVVVVVVVVPVAILKKVIECVSQSRNITRLKRV